MTSHSPTTTLDNAHLTTSLSSALTKSGVTLPAGGGNRLAVRSRAVLVQNAQVDDVDARCHASVNVVVTSGGCGAVAGDDASYVRSMSVLVTGCGIACHKALVVNDARSARRVVQIGVVGNAAIDHSNAHAGAVEAVLRRSNVASSSGDRIFVDIVHLHCAVRRDVSHVRILRNLRNHPGRNRHNGRADGAEPRV